MQRFYALVAEIDLVAEKESDDAKAEMVVRGWAEMHHRSMTEGSIVGLGGLLRPAHAKKLLRSAARQIRAAALEPEKVLTDAQERTRKRKALTLEGVSDLSFRDLQDWLSFAAMRVPDTKAKRVERLQEYFATKPKGFVLYGP